jgi:RNA recognition motif-containing protein
MFWDGFQWVAKSKD